MKWPGTKESLEEAIRNIELELGQVKRRQSGMIDSLKEIRDIVARTEKEIGKHDRWERRRAEE